MKFYLQKFQCSLYFSASFHFPSISSAQNKFPMYNATFTNSEPHHIPDWTINQDVRDQNRFHTTILSASGSQKTSAKRIPKESWKPIWEDLKHTWTNTSYQHGNTRGPSTKEVNPWQFNLSLVFWFKLFGVSCIETLGHLKTLKVTS